MIVGKSKPKRVCWFPAAPKGPPPRRSSMNPIRWFLVLITLSASVATADDWPTWRHDSQRSAVTAASLPKDLKLTWSRELGPNHIAWGEDPRLQFDASYQPIVVGKTLVVASARTHSVTAYHTESGGAAMVLPRRNSRSLRSDRNPGSALFWRR